MVWVGFRRDDETARETLENPEAWDDHLFEGDDDDEKCVDMDKAWHGLHRLLTGSAYATSDVASQAIFGGEPVGEDLGYGPPRLLSAVDVRSVAERLLHPGNDHDTGADSHHHTMNSPGPGF